MSAMPAGHVLLRDEFVHASADRLFLADRRSIELGPLESEVLASLERGESEFSLLCARLSSLEANPDPTRVARTLLELLARPSSILEFHAPLDLIEPEVIVVSFAADFDAGRTRTLVRRLRARHRVLHIGLKKRVRGAAGENLTAESVRAAGRELSDFQFVQLARSIVRFHRAAVLVVESSVDLALFADLLFDRPSVVLLDGQWPPRVQIQDLHGSEALVRDPRTALRSLFFALRFINLADPDLLNPRASSDLAALAVYGLQHATVVLWAGPGQVAALQRLGRRPGTDVPKLVRRLRRSSQPQTRDVLALAFDTDSLESVAPLLAGLHRALQSSERITRMAVRLAARWCSVVVSPQRVELAVWVASPPTFDEVACALVLPGALRDMDGFLDLIGAGIPTLFYPGGADHPLQAWIPDFARVQARTPAELGGVLDRAADPKSDLHARLVRHAHSLGRAYDAVERVTHVLETQVANRANASAAS